MSRGIHADVCGVLTHGSFQENAAYKPLFIKQMMFKHKTDNIVFLDADSEVRSPLPIFDEIPDYFMLAAPHVNGEYITKTLFVRNCDAASYFLDLWYKECSKMLVRVQTVFNTLVHDMHLDVFSLPHGYYHRDSDAEEDVHVHHNDITRLLEARDF